MYHCTDCKSFFNTPLKRNRGDCAFGKDCGSSLLCPFCKSANIKVYEPQYCRCCGRRLKKGERLYCSRACMKNGERLYNEQRQNKIRIKNSPIYVLVRKLKEYNEQHKTNLSYGQFVAGGYV